MSKLNTPARHTNTATYSNKAGKKNIIQSIHFMKCIFSAERPRPKC